MTALFPEEKVAQKASPKKDKSEPEEEEVSKRKAPKYAAVLPLRTDKKVKDQFGFAPVSVFRPQKSKYWDDLIDDKGDEVKTRRSGNNKYLPNLRFSKFHPELAEFCIRYWSMEGDVVVDPFAGRATRGVVAQTLGRRYRGYEISPITWKTTKRKVKSLGGKVFLSSGVDLAKTKKGVAGLVFTCPPYHRLEKYESVDGQLSDLKTYEEFCKQMKKCCKNVRRVLKKGRFAVFVVGDWRDGKEFRSFHVDLITMMKEVGMLHHDTVIVENNSPFTHLQMGKVAAKRYTSKTHEYALVFRKPGGVS
jgi:DNA modification methylase